MILEFSSADVSPDRSAVFENIGIPHGATVPEHIEGLCDTAGEMLEETVAPVGVLADISIADIFNRADHLGLFAVTLGEQTSQTIGECFEANDFALACVLDATASAAADKMAELAERRFDETLRTAGWTTPDGAALRYSPGYCGWDVTGQKKLFEYLQPEQIGLTLTDSCLMQPLKSVSGVVIAGPRQIHKFPLSYPFCSWCETRSCRARLHGLRTG